MDSLVFSFFRQDRQDLLDFLFFVSGRNKEYPTASGAIINSVVFSNNGSVNTISGHKNFIRGYWKP